MEVKDMQTILLVQWTCKNNPPAYANRMFLCQTKFPPWAQRNSVTHLVPFPPEHWGWQNTKSKLCPKFFYTSIISNTFYLVYLECSRRNWCFWQWPNFIMPRFSFSVPLLVGFLPGILIKGPAGDGGSPANVLCLLSYCRGQNNSRIKAAVFEVYSKTENPTTYSDRYTSKWT